MDFDFDESFRRHIESESEKIEETAAPYIDRNEKDLTKLVMQMSIANMQVTLNITKAVLKDYQDFINSAK